MQFHSFWCLLVLSCCSPLVRPFRAYARRMASVRIDKGIHAVSSILVFVGCILLQPLGLSILGICNAHSLCKDRHRHSCSLQFPSFGCLLVLSCCSPLVRPSQVCNAHNLCKDRQGHSCCFLHSRASWLYPAAAPWSVHSGYVQCAWPL